jgi:DNA-binding protein Fis
VEPLLPATEADVRSLEELQRLYFRHVWQLVGGSTKRAAELLGVVPNTIRKYLKPGPK